MHARLAQGGSASPKTMEILAEGANIGGKTAFVANALRTTRSTFLQVIRCRLSPLSGIPRPVDCTVPGKATEPYPFRYIKGARRPQGGGYKGLPDHTKDRIFVLATSLMRLRRPDHVSTESS
jgi:hypothetical protein